MYDLTESQSEAIYVDILVREICVCVCRAPREARLSYMITRLRVKNYLSLQDVDVELGRRNTIFVGPNMAGKSNLIDCFKFLAHMVQLGLNRALLDRGGFPEVVWKGSDEHRLTLQLNAEVGEKKTYDYTIVVVGSATGLISVEKELLVVRTENQSA